MFRRMPANVAVEAIKADGGIIPDLIQGMVELLPNHSALFGLERFGSTELLTSEGWFSLVWGSFRDLTATFNRRQSEIADLNRMFTGEKIPSPWTPEAILRFEELGKRYRTE